jgi:hypothetical protein
MFQKVLLSTDSSERKLINIQWVYSSSIDDSYKNKYITMSCETAVSEMNAYVTTINALDQFTQEAE